MKPLLQVSQLTFHYGARPILQGINLTIPTGQYHCLIGPNGSGKTTLFHLLCGLLPVQQGSIVYLGQPLQRIPLRERARRLALVAQRQNALFSFTCLEMVLMGLYPQGGHLYGQPFGLQQAQQVMEETGCLHLALQPVTAISGGELQRVLLARALLQNPQILFLDEAMSELDIAARLQMLRLLKKRIAQQGLTVFAIHHDLSNAYLFADQIYALHQGRIAAQGSPQTVFTPALLANVFGVKGEILPDKGLFLYDTISKF